MDVRLPNGTIIKNVPEGTSKEAIMQKAIASGLAKPIDFGIQPEVKPSTNEQPSVDQAGMPQLSMYENPATTGGIKQPEKQYGLRDLAAPLEVGATAVTGALSSLQGVATGIVDAITSGKIGSEEGVKLIEQSMQDYARAGTYQPKSQSAQDALQVAGETLGALPPVVGAFSPSQLAAAGQSAKMTAQVAPTLARESAQVAKQTVQSAMPQASSVRSMGAAEVPGEVVQYQKFQDLPVPVTPTMSDLAVGDDRFAWKQFENEIAKDADLGAKVRDAAAVKNSQIQQNFDEFIDMTGTTLPETNYQYATGNKVVDALYGGLEADKKRVNNAYQVAREKGELAAPVPQERLDTISRFINDNRAKRTNAPVLQGFVDEAFVKEVGEGSLADGTFRLKPLTIEQAETMRQEVNRLTDQANAQDIRYASEIKKMIDDAQEGLGGNAFKSARKQARQMYDKYENYQLIDQLLSEKKGYKDARVPAEMVVQKAVMSGSVDDLKQFRSVLQRSGADGMAAWRDVQAAVLRSIRDGAVKGKSAVDNTGLIKAQAGAINKAVDNLDKNGKLDLIFGKQDADKLRLLSEVSSRVAEQMPGTFNSSNNMAWVSMMKKIPIVGGTIDVIQDAASLVRDNKTRAKVRQAVNVEKTLKKRGVDVEQYKQKP
jgi:hypothetical protein